MRFRRKGEPEGGLRPALHVAHLLPHASNAARHSGNDGSTSDRAPRLPHRAIRLRPHEAPGMSEVNSSLAENRSLTRGGPPPDEVTKITHTRVETDLGMLTVVGR